ncbi:hypothetical protein [Nocardia inohanensis]|uniref:hypothetical protein n=1 Tax=Nocardia inohanensis TaxID=209246 RepID=UPI000830CE55|nr:hypothetical protein [Nocardia inohanensis]
MAAQLSYRSWKYTSRAIAGATAILCLTVLWVELSRESAGSLPLTLLMLGLTGLLWLITAAIGVIRYRAWLPSLLAPLVVLLTLAVTWSGFPAHFGWTLSRDALERTAVTCSPTTGTRVGVYRVTAIEKRRDGCLIQISGGFPTLSGFAYFPGAAPPADDDGISYVRIEGPWYRFDESF